MSFVLPTRVRLPKAFEAHRSRIPAGVRRFLGDGLLAAPGRLARDTRWALRDAGAISRWTDERLALDGYYWLFVLGLNNSGTTLLARVLARHPLVRALPEEGAKLTDAFPRTRAHGVGRVATERPDLFRWSEDHDPTPARRARYDWAHHYPKRPGILLEKSPQHTFRARWIQRNFRPARFLVTIRNPYAVCEGIRRRGRVSLERAALHWVRGHEFLLEDLCHLDHALRLSYEAFCEAPEAELERIRAFLGLETPFDAAVALGPVPAPTLDGRARPIFDQNAASLDRLSAADVETITRIAGPMMERLGYRPLE